MERLTAVASARTRGFLAGVCLVAWIIGSGCATGEWSTHNRVTVTRNMPHTINYSVAATVIGIPNKKLDETSSAIIGAINAV